jgi:hypothetical protein
MLRRNFPGLSLAKCRSSSLEATGVGVAAGDGLSRGGSGDWPESEDAIVNKKNKTAILLFKNGLTSFPST